MANKYDIRENYFIKTVSNAFGQDTRIAEFVIDRLKKENIKFDYQDKDFLDKFSQYYSFELLSEDVFDDIPTFYVYDRLLRLFKNQIFDYRNLSIIEDKIY